jgi:hypothetical protein
LQNKFQNPWRALAEPLEHLPDAQGVKYHLQLNIYRFIMEKYYGYVVFSMFVVCLHPELQDGPWVDEVPAMPAEICAIMQVCRDQIRRQGCGSPHVSPTVDVSGGAANFAEDGAWDRFKLLRAVL